MYEFMNGNLHYCPFLCHFIYCMPFWKIANVNVCFLRSFWRFLKERMESCSNSKVLEEFSCRHSKRRCFTKNNKNNIKKLKKQIHCSTTNTHTNKKKRSTNKKNMSFLLPSSLPFNPLQPPHQLNPFSTSLLVLRGLFRWRIAGITGVAGSLARARLAHARNVASRLMILLMEEIRLTSWGWRDLYTIPGEKTRRITVRTINSSGDMEKAIPKLKHPKLDLTEPTLFKGIWGGIDFFWENDSKMWSSNGKSCCAFPQFLTRPIQAPD